MMFVRRKSMRTTRTAEEGVEIHWKWEKGEGKASREMATSPPPDCKTAARAHRFASMVNRQIDRCASAKSRKRETGFEWPRVERRGRPPVR